MTTRLQRESPWQPSPVRCTSAYVYARVLSLHMAIYVSALYMCCVRTMKQQHMHILLWNGSHAKLARSSEQGLEAQANNRPTNLGTLPISFALLSLNHSNQVC